MGDRGGARGRGEEVGEAGLVRLVMWRQWRRGIWGGGREGGGQR